MIKKAPFVLIISLLLIGNAFSQQHRHEKSDMLLGIGMGYGISPGIFSVLSNDDYSKNGGYAIYGEYGLNFDFYVNNYISFNTGLLYRWDLYVIVYDVKRGNEVVYYEDYKFPLCVTFPLAVHLNIPRAEFLYIGAGVHFNFPILILGDSDDNFDTQGNYFIGLPIDIGFDFIRPKSGGARLFFRIIPEIHNKGTAVPVGFYVQFHNWKLNNR